MLGATAQSAYHRFIIFPIIAEMTDQEMVRIKPFDDTSDYALWRLRVKWASDGKGTTAAFTSNMPLADVASVMCAKHRLKVGSLSVAACRDHALRVVKRFNANQISIMEKLDARYDSKTSASKITKMVGVVSVC